MAGSPAPVHAAASSAGLREQNRTQQSSLGDGYDPCGLRQRRLPHLVAVIDCHDRELIGWEFALRGRAKEAERAIQEACISHFGTLRPAGSAPVIRSDNGFIFHSRRFRAACRDYRLSQEFITPYIPEQNGIIERFFRSLKGECVWQFNFGSFPEAKKAIAKWIEW
jgi:putative transposase